MQTSSPKKKFPEEAIGESTSSVRQELERVAKPIDKPAAGESQESPNDPTNGALKTVPSRPAELSRVNRIPEIPQNNAGAEGRLLRAREEYARGELPRALASVRSARRLVPQSATALRLEAQIRLDLGDRTGYVQTVKESAAAHPNSARAQNTVGRLLVQAGEFEQGLPLLRRAVELAPGRTRYARDLAAAYLGNRQDDTVREVLLKAARRAPHDRDLPLVLARVFESEGAWTEAARYYGMVAAADDQTSHWRRQLARCFYHAGDYEQAVEYFGEFAVGECGELTLAEHIQYGDACLRLGCFDAASVVFDHAAQSAPGRWREVELLRCICRLNAGQGEQARELINAALVYWPGDETLTQMIELCDGDDAE